MVLAVPEQQRVTYSHRRRALLPKVVDYSSRDSLLLLLSAIETTVIQLNEIQADAAARLKALQAPTAIEFCSDREQSAVRRVDLSDATVQKEKVAKFGALVAELREAVHAN